MDNWKDTKYPLPPTADRSSAGEDWAMLLKIGGSVALLGGGIAWLLVALL